MFQHVSVFTMLNALDKGVLTTLYIAHINRINKINKMERLEPHIASILTSCVHVVCSSLHIFRLAIYEPQNTFPCVCVCVCECVCVCVCVCVCL